MAHAVEAQRPTLVGWMVAGMRSHFAGPVHVCDSSYLRRKGPGYSSVTLRASLGWLAFLDGAAWRPILGIGAEAEDIVVDGVQPAPR